MREHVRPSVCHVMLEQRLLLVPDLVKPHVLHAQMHRTFPHGQPLGGLLQQIVQRTSAKLIHVPLDIF